MNNFDVTQLNWEKMDQLIPAIIQDAQTHTVLMLGYMDPESLERTIQTGLVTFYSRSKQRLWTKGESSGHTLKVQALSSDCDGDALLILANPEGPTCHQGSDSCFSAIEESSWTTVQKLERTIERRLSTMPENSYVAKLVCAGLNKVAQKVGEEAVEVVIAALNEGHEAFAQEFTDLLFHMLVLLKAKGMSFADISAIIKERAMG